jgi:hypothetical protein
VGRVFAHKIIASASGFCVALGQIRIFFDKFFVEQGGKV